MRIPKRKNGYKAIDKTVTKTALKSLRKNPTASLTGFSKMRFTRYAISSAGRITYILIIPSTVMYSRRDIAITAINVTAKSLINPYFFRELLLLLAKRRKSARMSFKFDTISRGTVRRLLTKSPIEPAAIENTPIAAPQMPVHIKLCKISI